MKIITRYVLKQHIGPLIFALTALTSLLMLQYVARQLGNLVGKGIPWKVIGEFFVLSLPFTVAMTMPMAVLVATLHAFGRMASENEITAFKANGVRVTRLMMPVLIGAGLLVLAMVGFNDQILPRANHKLRMLQQDMSRAKPTLALNEQVLNQITNGVYMRIGHLDRESNLMKDVTLYDLTDPQTRKTIYADSGELSFTTDKKDLQLVLYDGYQQELGTTSQRQLQRSYFRSQAVRVKDVGGDFEQSGNDTWKGNREKSICEMQNEYVLNAKDYERVRELYIEAARRGAAAGQKTLRVPRPRPPTQGIARLYCNALALVFRVPTAQPSGTITAQPAVAVGQAPNAQAPIGAPVTPGAPTLAAGANPVPAGTVAGQPPVNASGTAGNPPVVIGPEMQAQIDAFNASMKQQAQPQVQQTAPVPTVAAKASTDSVKNVASTSTSAKGDSTRAALPAMPVTAASAEINPPPFVPPGSTPVAVQSGLTAVPPAAAAVAPANAGVPQSSSVSVVPPTNPAPATSQPIPAGAAAQQATPTPAASTPAASAGQTAVAFSPSGGPGEIAAANAQLSVVRASMDDLAVEVQKKFALSVACIVFVLFGPPIALRFPRGGVGATLGVSLVVFGLYYICLMAGETLADDGKLPPAIAMWAANVIFSVLGLLLLLRIEKTADASRGGGIRAWFEDRKAKRALRNVRVPAPSTATV